MVRSHYFYKFQPNGIKRFGIDQTNKSLLTLTLAIRGKILNHKWRHSAIIAQQQIHYLVHFSLLVIIAA